MNYEIIHKLTDESQIKDLPYVMLVSGVYVFPPSPTQGAHTLLVCISLDCLLGANNHKLPI